MGTSKVHWTEVAGADPYSEDELREMGTSKEHWSELADADPYSENELREMNKETFGNLKAQWSHFFLDNTENLVVSEKFAQGGQATIFEAHWPDWEGVLPHSNGLVLKVFDRRSLLRDLQRQWPEEFLRYANHANEAGKLWNPRICRIFGALLLDNGAFAFAMERCWGDLRTVIDIRMRNNGNQGSPFSTTVAKRIMLEIAEGIQGLHELGIIHRDVKPTNIFIKPIDDVLGDPKAVYIPISSFGDVHGDTKASDVPILSSGKGWNPIKDDAFSCVVGDYECNVDVTGTGFWRAPEILLAWKNRDFRSCLFTQAVDVYSYSMTCFEILTGEYPFQGIPVNNYDHVLNGTRPQLPKTVDLATKTLLSRCWHHDPSQRPTFIEICKELRIMISQPEPIAFEPQVDNEGNLEPIALSQSNCFPEELNGFKSFHTLIVGLLMFVEPISNVLASFTDLGCYFFVSFIQWIYIYLGSFGQHKEQASICMRVRSRDLKLVQFLGQGFSGFIYETSWLTWYGREKPGRFARKSFPRVGNMVFESEAIRLVHLDHPNVVKAFCWTVDKLGCSLVLEFVNTDIESVVEKRKEAQRKVSASKDLLGLGNLDKSINGTISPFELVDQIYIMLHIARAMEYLHSKGVGHGDLRPNNILIDLEADPMIVKVVDFGLLESKKRSSLVSKRTQFVRTLEWKAPETWKELPTSLLDSPDEYLWDEMDLMKEGGNASAVGELVDVYSFAVTCTYIMGETISYPKLSLSQLQQEISSGTLRPKIPSKCPEVLRKLIELSWDSDPQKRLRFSYLRGQLEESFHLVEQVKEKAQAKGAFSGENTMGHESNDVEMLELPNLVVGIDDKLKELHEKLNTSSIVGLVGMGGVGKTTLSKAMYNSEWKHYTRCSYLEDVKLHTNILGFQKQLLRELCGEKWDDNEDPEVYMRKIEQCIQTTNVLVVIDDVGSESNLKALHVDAFQKGSSGSKLVITCRERRILGEYLSQEEEIEVAELNYEQSMKLFSHYVFPEFNLIEERGEFESEAASIVRACGGLPRSIEIIGQHLRKQNRLPKDERLQIWKEALERLKEGVAWSRGLFT